MDQRRTVYKCRRMFRLFKNHIYNRISNARDKNTSKFSIAKYVYRVRSEVERASKIFSLKAKFQTRLVTLPIKFLEIPKPICTIQVLCFQPVHDSCVRLIVSIHWPFSRVTKHGLHLVPRPNVVHTFTRADVHVVTLGLYVHVKTGAFFFVFRLLASPRLLIFHSRNYATWSCFFHVHSYVHNDVLG